MQIKIIQFNSNEHRQEIELRNQVLRLPLGLKLSQDELDKEYNDIHIGCFKSNDIVGTLILTPIDTQSVRMRQVAVSDQWRGEGVGTELINFAESLAQKNRFSKIVLSARTEVIKFYKKMGYQTNGSEYISTSTHIPHVEMIKYIA